MEPRVPIRTVLVRALLAVGLAVVAGTAAPRPVSPAAAAAPTGFHPLGPVRVLDTRTATSGALGAGTTREVDIAAAVGTPAEATGVVLNVTVTEPSDASFVTVWPTGRPRPATSNLNMRAGQTVANLVLVGLGAGGHVSVFNNAGATQLVVDVSGWLDGAFTALSPLRLVDTRIRLGAGSLGPGARTDVVVAGAGGVPASAMAVALNVTATDPTSASFVTVWPAGVTRPFTSNLNVVSGQTVPNAVVVGLGAGGAVSIYNAQGTTDVIVDVMGWFSGAITGITPARLLDTRESTCGAALHAGETRTLAVTGRGGVPVDGVGGVVLNVTATEATSASYLTVWPTGQPRPLASNLNVVAGSTVPNLVLTGLGAGGQVDIYNNAGQVDVVVDGFGWFPGLTPAGSPVPCPTSSATVVTRGRTDRRAVALTFDAGSDSGNTTRILDTLAAEQVPASFALTGAWARANPELAARIGTYADVILNHSDDHPSFTGYSTGLPALTAAERRDQLARAETAIVAATGRAARPWFRPPYGDRDASVDRDIGAAGYRYDVMWTIDSFGWKGVPPATVVSRVLTNAVPGAIVVMHVGAASTDIDALVDVIGGLRADGYELVSLPALLGVAAT